jgi:hypothetical protein
MKQLRGSAKPAVFCDRGEIAQVSQFHAIILSDPAIGFSDGFLRNKVRIRKTPF